jgi:hypothetical protein
MQTMYTYKEATGYYQAYSEDPGNRRKTCPFWVRKGSKASGSTSNAFDNIPHLSDLRDWLIDAIGVLARTGDDGPYTFSRDHKFGSASEAASIIDGNSRSGRVWKQR